jgi:hypothetical protein
MRYRGVKRGKEEGPSRVAAAITLALVFVYRRLFNFANHRSYDDVAPDRSF